MREVWLENAVARRVLLARLYAERMQATVQEIGGFMPRRVLAELVTPVDFILATLVEQGFVYRDGDRYRITGAGCVHLESTTKE